MSARRATGSTAGSRRRRLSRASAERGGRTGRSSATALPERVIVIRSPRAARSTTSPPWLRRSRMLTSDMQVNVSRVIRSLCVHHLFDPSEIPGGRPYEEMRPRAVEAVVQGIGIRAAGFDDLIRLKRESGRDRDLEDVATLLAARRRAE